MTLSIYIAAVLIAKAINPNFITENLVLCFISFAVCAILQLFEIAMSMKRSVPKQEPNKKTYTPEYKKS